MRRDAERVFERPSEMRFGDAVLARETPDRPLLMLRRVHPFLRAQQPAQDIGIDHLSVFIFSQ